MNTNYNYVLQKVQTISPRGRTLDYGCGGGDVVGKGRAMGLDICGVETFYAGSNARITAEQRGYLGQTVFEIDCAGRIPFEDGYFNFVVSNQVFEHVEDLDFVLREINRVLIPGGQLLTLFPSREVIREGHCGVPMIHWLTKDSSLRYPYMRIARELGMGYFKTGKTKDCWVRDFLDWLDHFTIYRSYDEIAASFSKAGFSVQHMEEDYIGFRLRLRGAHGLASWAESSTLRKLTRILCRKLGGVVILATAKQ